MVSNAKKKYNHQVVSKLKTRFMPLSTCKLTCIYNFYIIVFHSHNYYFHFLLFESKSNVKFCHNNFLLLIVSHYMYHWTRNRKSVTDEI